MEGNGHSEGTDYKLSFSSNKKPGIKGTVTVKGQGNFAKTASEIFDVTSGDLSRAYHECCRSQI